MHNALVECDLLQEAKPLANECNALDFQVHLGCLG